jgi:uncharacterized protein
MTVLQPGTPITRILALITNSHREHSPHRQLVAEDTLFFRTFLIKVTARCNINCSYCYEYNSADQSWRKKPPVMSMEVLRRVVFRIKEHVELHKLTSLFFILHGGEPLLAGLSFIENVLTLLHEEFDGYGKVQIGIQSNGLLLNEEWAELLLRHNTTIGISIDGDRSANDRFRLDKSGHSTYDRVENALRLVCKEQWRPINAGILSVMQPDTDVEKAIDWYLQWAPTRVDFLFPHYNHINPPPGAWSPEHGYGFGKWLVDAFDVWWDRDLSDLNIRIFEDIIHLSLGGYYTVESLGLSAVRIALFQTDGSYEALDSLKSAFDGAVFTGRNVFEHSLEDLLELNGFRDRLSRFDALHEKCKECDIVQVCGGGYVPHRYSGATGYRAPSIYCRDLEYLIRHILKRTAGLALEAEVDTDHLVPLV